MPSVHKNALAFNSRKDFNGFVQDLHKKPSDKLNAYIEKQAKGFTSLKQRQDKIRENDSPNFKSSAESSEILQLNIQDPTFASIVNENGVFQIDEQVFKVTNKYTYIFKNRDAYEIYDFSANNTPGPVQTYMAVDPCYETNPELTQLNNNAYRIENCGGGGGGGGYDPGDDDDDNSYPNQDVIDLDPNDNPDTDYSSKRTQEYRSGGTKGRLKGLYLGTKTGEFIVVLVPKQNINDILGDVGQIELLSKLLWIHI